MFFSCREMTKDTDRSKLLGYDYRLFENTPGWNLAKAVRDQDSAKIQRLFLEDKVDLNYQEPKFGNTVLMLAIGNDAYRSVEVLLKLGADPNLKNKSAGYSAMHDAAIAPTTRYVNILLKYKGNPNIVSGGDYRDTIAQKTPLNLAITYSDEKNFPKVRSLVQAGADVNYYWKGYIYSPGSPLSDAVSQYKFDIALYLLEQGADYNTIMYKTVDNDSIFILASLRRKIVDIDSREYQFKRQVISFLKNRGLDYDKEPIPEFIMRDIMRRYPEKWKEYAKSY